jgi:hypothetical protein
MTLHHHISREGEKREGKGFFREDRYMSSTCTDTRTGKIIP